MRYERDVIVTKSTLGVAAHDGRPALHRVDDAVHRPALVVDAVQRLRLDDVSIASGECCELMARNSSGNWSDGGHLRACEATCARVTGGLTGRTEASCVWGSEPIPTFVPGMSK